MPTDIEKLSYFTAMTLTLTYDLVTQTFVDIVVTY